MDQKIYNLESKINILYDFIYNLNTIDCFSFEEITPENITIDDIKIPLIDNNKDSKQDIEIYNNYKTDIINTRFKITSFNNDTKQIILKRYSDDYPVSIKINFYKYNDTKINSLDTYINNDSLLSYLLSQLVLNKQTIHLLLPIINIDMLFTDIEHILKTDDCYDKLKFALNNNEISNICCLQLREQFFKIMVLEDYLSKNKCSHKGLIFQIVHTLAVLQTRYPGFRHNNLILKNIVIYLKKMNNDYTIYNNFNKKSNEKFYVPNFGFDIKITNFENTIIPNVYTSLHTKNTQSNNTLNNCIGSFNINNPNIKFADQPNPYYDIYTFLLDFINKVSEELLEDTVCNIETRDFLNKIIPLHLRDKTATKSGSLTLNKFNKNYNIISAVELLNDKYFDEFKNKQDQVVDNTKIISNNYFTGMQQYTTILESDKYSVLGHQDNLISKYNIMTSEYTDTESRKIHKDSSNVVKLRRLNIMTGDDSFIQDSHSIDKVVKSTRRISSTHDNSNTSDKQRNIKKHSNKQYNMKGGSSAIQSSSNMVQSTSFKKEKHTPFTSNDEKRINTSRYQENPIKEPPVILEQKIYDTTQKSSPKTQFPPAYIPLHDVDGIPHNLLPYTKMINQPPIQKVYNISLSSPFVNHTSISNIYEDTLPNEINALTSTTVNDRCQIITFLRNTLLDKQDGETMNVTGGNNTLLSYIKLLDVNPYTKHQFSSLASDFLLYSAAYPIRFDVNSGKIILSKNAMGINLRIYMMSVGELLIDTIHKDITRHHFDLWRELDYYEWVKRIIRNKVSPNFISPILYKIDDESHINWEQLKDIRIKNGVNINVIKSSNNQSINKLHNIPAQGTYLPTLKSMYSYNKNKQHFPLVNNTPLTGKLDLTQNSGQSLILLTEAPTTSFINWFTQQYESHGSINKMVSTGHHSSATWMSILFQFVYAMSVLQKEQIYINHLSLDNIYIKDNNINQNSIGSWIYIVDGIHYYVPNYGYVLLIDTTYKDIDKSTVPSAITPQQLTAPNTITYPIVMAALTAGYAVNKGMTSDRALEIVTAAYNAAGSSGSALLGKLNVGLMPINLPNTDPKIYKIYGKLYSKDDPISKKLCEVTSPSLIAPIHDLIFSQFEQIINVDNFKYHNTIPDDINSLIRNINAELKRLTTKNIYELIPMFFSSYLHNRIGTPLLKSERENIPLLSNFNLKKSSLIIWQSRNDTYIWVIYMGIADSTKSKFHHKIIINNKFKIEIVHEASLYVYPSSERILPTSSSTMKYDETNIFETYNLDNI